MKLQNEGAFPPAATEYLSESIIPRDITLRLRFSGSALC